MEIKPIGGGGKPGYPPKNEWNGDLTQHVPKRWKGRKAVYGALLCSGLAGALFIVAPVRTAGAQLTSNISEWEALRIAENEAAKLGIGLYPKYKQVEVSVGGKKVTHDLDLIDEEGRFAIEFISRRDREEFQSPDASIEKVLSSSLKKDKLKVIPLPGPSDGTREEQTELIRKQVKDFLTWLKQQGVI